MSKDILTLIPAMEKPEELRQLMKNARVIKREDVYCAAFRRLCELEGKNSEDSLHREFYGVLAAYEELLSEKNGRKTPASRTRQKLKRHGVEKCLEDWALSTSPTQGFSMLMEHHMPELTAEFLVVKYPDRFSKEAVAAAQKRLDSQKAA